MREYPKFGKPFKNFRAHKGNTYFLKTKRTKSILMLETINEQLKTNFFSNPEIQKSLTSTKKAVQNDEISPFAAAQKLLETYFKKE
jgi:LAO/AO transport system kinase